MSPNIIWLASYPKSGNTWVRYLLANYFFNKEKKDDFSIKRFIPKFPRGDWFKFIENKKNEIISNPHEISKYWIQSQEKIEDYIFLKTHNALLSISNYSFTDETRSLAALHIVRDPRDIVVSYAKFLKRNYDKQIELLLSEKLHYNINKNRPFAVEFLGSWGFHYKSWKEGCPKIPKLLVKYEDLLVDTNKQSRKIIVFLSKLLKFNIDEDQIDFAVRNSSFDILSKQEKIFGFDEQNESKDPFFRNGQKDQWKDHLTLKQIKKIEKILTKEMKELGYL